MHENGQERFHFREKEDLSETGKHYLAGLLAHARGACAFATPTINGYKRYRPYSLAPDRVIWGKENRGAMLRVIGGAGRPGDPHREPHRRAGGESLPVFRLADLLAASTASQRRLAPPPLGRHALRGQGRAPAAHARRGARSACAGDKALRDGLGETFVDYYCRIKEAEIARFNLEVSDWEQREYFDLF